MTYPNAQDYIQAVQQPQRAFRSPDLRGATFELHPTWGIPVPASGNAAVVFKATVAGSPAALRFFIREDASSHERYAALGRHFVDRHIDDCVAQATWVDDAIQIKDAAWPMVQMAWVDGRTLDAYVGHLATAGNVAALAALADSWRTLVGRLQSAEFAHGDLQHGNVLVDTASSLRLVDFDGSWIEALSGGPAPNETGHPNYQRTGRDWGRWMDSFPALVIYTALLTLSRRPDAWAQLHTGENILFSAGDFSPPFRTPAWETVTGVGDAEVRHAAERLQEACTPGWQAGDTLEALLMERPRIVVLPDDREAAPLYPGAFPASREIAWWERTNAPAAGTASAGMAAPPRASADPQVSMPPPPPKTGPIRNEPDTPSFAQPHGAWFPPPTRASGPGRPAPGWGSGAGSGPKPGPGLKSGSGSKPGPKPGSGPKPGPGWPPGSGSWPGGPASGPGRAVPPGAQRPLGQAVFLLLLVVGLTAVIAAVIVAAAGGDAVAAAVVSGLIAGLIAARRVRKKE
jgi:hypothetical protein